MLLSIFPCGAVDPSEMIGCPSSSSFDMFDSNTSLNTFSVGIPVSMSNPSRTTLRSAVASAAPIMLRVLSSNSTARL